MGTYVSYALGAHDGIRSRFLGDIAAFAAWFTEAAEEFPFDYPDDQLPKTRDFVQRGELAFRAATATEADLIDRVVDEYWNYCGMKNLHGDRDITSSMLYLRRYATELSDVLPTSSGTAQDYYRSLFKGRSLEEHSNHAYRSGDGIFYLSWLLPAEVAVFFAELAPLVPPLKPGTDEAHGVITLYRALEQAASAGTSLIIVVA